MRRFFIDSRFAETVVLKPSQLDPNDRQRRLDELRHQEDKITSEGWVVDSEPTITLTGESGRPTASECHHQAETEFYTDNPGFPDQLFAENAIEPDAQAYILEAELCARCDRPVGEILGCIKWYMIKVKGRMGTRTFLVTRDAVQAQPSPQFKRAVERWRSD